MQIPAGFLLEFAGMLREWMDSRTSNPQAAWLVFLRCLQQAKLTLSLTQIACLRSSLSFC